MLSVTHRQTMGKLCAKLIKIRLINDEVMLLTKKLYHNVIYRHLTYKSDLDPGGNDLGVERDTSFN